MRLAPSCERIGLSMGGHQRGVLFASAVIQMQRRYCWEPKDLKPKVKFPLSESQYAEKEVEVLAQKRASASPASYHRAAETVPPWELGNRGNRGRRRKKKKKKKKKKNWGAMGQPTECLFCWSFFQCVLESINLMCKCNVYIMCLSINLMCKYVERDIFEIKVHVDKICTI